MTPRTVLAAVTLSVLAAGCGSTVARSAGSTTAPPSTPTTAAPSTTTPSTTTPSTTGGSTAAPPTTDPTPSLTIPLVAGNSGSGGATGTAMAETQLDRSAQALQADLAAIQAATSAGATAAADGQLQAALQLAASLPYPAGAPAQAQWQKALAALQQAAGGLATSTAKAAPGSPNPTKTAAAGGSIKMVIDELNSGYDLLAKVGKALKPLITWHLVIVNTAPSEGIVVANPGGIMCGQGATTTKAGPAGTAGQSACEATEYDFTSVSIILSGVPAPGGGDYAVSTVTPSPNTWSCGNPPKPTPDFACNVIPAALTSDLTVTVRWVAPTKTP